MPTLIAINGFGRIGRAAFKIIQDMENVEVVAINDLTPLETLVNLLKYDTVYGKYDKAVSVESEYLVIEGKKIPFFQEKDPLNLPWSDLKVDVVLECTGHFVKDGAAKVHLDAGALRVVVSAPTKGEGNIKTYLKGVNSVDYEDDGVISNASCTTNCIAPAISIVHSAFGVQKAAMTTIHAATSTQNLVDGPNKDPRRGRSAMQNIIPTTTGAAVATTKVIPDLDGKFDGMAVRVPVLVGSLSDITMLVERNTTIEEVNEVFKKAVENPIYKNVVEVTEEPIVSSDIIKNPHSSIIDLSFTNVIDGNLVKVLTWYDNEWGYSNRLVEMALLVAQ